MVQAVENWAEVEGDVLSLGPARPPSPSGFVAAQLSAAEVRDVAGYPNLLGPGGDLVLLVRHERAEAAGLAVGSHLVARARLAGPGRAFVHPEHFEVVRAGS